ncbi:MAG: ribosomal protein S18-alanine N-acetyltransferase [Proteobacteria bacterium]|uniref:Ribosomal protein S18-alanine N-acetyltransferase n=1 Tax=Candidatus Avisuccinivibrio stercorigallinarum TaxID=2840704 RepID=A0A9D9DA67_9GAMM|nr:ribosomal protein S18-alanine N-acetyltransferase [Candidatus Avisuccinivibrio stercorigallinarum]
MCAENNTASAASASASAVSASGQPGRQHCRLKYEITEIKKPGEAQLKDLFAIELSAHLNPWSYDNIKACFTPFNHVLAIYVQGVMAGFAIVQLIAGEAELLTIGIKREKQGQGLGRALLNAVLDFCRAAQAQCMFLEVRVGNEPAKALYLSSGFEIVGVREHYYEAAGGHPAEDAYTMRLDMQ